MNLNFKFHIASLRYSKSTFLLLFFVLCFFKSVAFELEKDTALIKRFFTTKYIFFENKERIPKIFFKAYKKTFESEIDIASKNEDYNSTDVVINQLPNTRLIFGGVDSTNKYGFIFFNEGGIIITKHFLVFDISSKKRSKFFSLSIEEDVKDFEKLKLVVHNKIPVLRGVP